MGRGPDLHIVLPRLGIGLRDAMNRSTPSAFKIIHDYGSFSLLFAYKLRPRPLPSFQLLQFKKTLWITSMQAIRF